MYAQFERENIKIYMEVIGGIGYTKTFYNLMVIEGLGYTVHTINR